MKLSNESKESILFESIILLIILIFSYYLFGAAGIRVALGIVFMSLPFYLILNNFDFGEGEKFVLSILMGITLFPSFAYLLGLIISFRIAIAVSFAVFLATAAIMWKYKQPNA